MVLHITPRTSMRLLDHLYSTTSLVMVVGRIVVGVKTKFTSTVKLGNNAERITKLSDFFIDGAKIRTINRCQHCADGSACSDDVRR